MHATVPHSALRPFIGQLWASASPGHPAGTREHVLPTGRMHMVFRLAGDALRIHAPGDGAAGSRIDGPVLGGPRTSFYAKDVAGPVVSVGVELLPGATLALFGVSAEELAGRHTPLAELWGPAADSLLQQLAEERDPLRRLARLECVLARRLAGQPGPHAAVARALAGQAPGDRIAGMVGASGYSHRGFIALFRQAVGMSPKQHARLLRFRLLLAAMRDDPAAPLGALAYAAGYSDQAHMTREFRECAGITPARYRALAPAAAHHVAIPPQSQIRSRQAGGPVR